MDSNLSTCFSTEKMLLIFAGFYWSKPSKFPVLFYLSRIVNWGMNVLLLLSSLLLIFSEDVEITVLTGCWLLSVTQVAFLVKLQIFYMKRFDLQNIEEFLLKSPFNDYSEVKIKAINENFGICRKMFRVYRTFCILTTIGYILYPLIDPNDGHLLAIPGYIPWDIVKYNFLTNFLQAFTVASSAYLNSTLDILFVDLITIATVQFQVLNEQLEKFDYTEPEVIVEQKLKTVFQYHKQILAYVKKVEELFTNCLFFQFMASVLVICLTGFQMLIIDLFSIQFLMLTSYFLCMMTQVFIFCWCGQLLTYQSDALLRSSYIGNWYESKPKSRKMLLIFSERCKRPTVVTAAKFFSLSLTTLIIILKSSYSYFAVLRSVYVKRIE